MIPIECLNMDISKWKGLRSTEAESVSNSGQRLIDAWNQFLSNIMAHKSDSKSGYSSKSKTDALDRFEKEFEERLSTQSLANDTPLAKTLNASLIQANQFREILLGEFEISVSSPLMFVIGWGVRSLAREFELFANEFERELELERSRQAEWQRNCQRVEDGLPAIDFCPVL